MDHTTTKLRYADLDDRMRQLVADVHSCMEMYLTEESEPDPDVWPHWKHGEFTDQSFIAATFDVCLEWQIDRAEDAGEEPPRPYGRRELGFAFSIYGQVVDDMLLEEANYFKRLADKWVAVYPECATLGEVVAMHEKAGRA
jgi:hypothetical protein